MGKKYVIVKDTYLSGWGLAEGKDNILIFKCKDIIQANNVLENCNNRSDFKVIGIFCTPPNKYANSEKYFVEYKSKKEMPIIYREHGEE